MKRKPIKMRTGIIIVIVLFAILPAVLIFSRMYNDMEKKTATLLKEEALNSTSLIGNQLGKDVEKLISASNIMISNSQVNALLCGKQPIPNTSMPLNWLLFERFNLIRTSILLGFNSNIDVFDSTGKIYTSQLNLTPTNQGWRQAEWFQRAQSLNNIPVLTGYQDSSGQYFIILARRMWDYGHTKNTSLSVIYILEDNFYQQRVKSQLNTNDLIYIAERDGTIISHEDKSMLGEKPPQIDVLQVAMAEGVTLTTDNQHNSLLITCAPIPNSNWMVVRVSNYAVVQRQFAYSFGSSLLLMSLAFICMIILTLLVLLRITRPITVLSHSMRSIQDSSVRKAPLEISSDFREMHDLCDSFNKMVNQINILIEDVKEQQQKESQLMIKMLQAQINPHFLFNTLNTIRWIAIVNNCGTVADMTENLGKILETAISDSRKMITLEKEMEITKSYMAIQAVRFNQWNSERMNISIDVSNCMVPKLILQPIIENCFKHAMKGVVSHDIVISIHAFPQDANLVIEISDNGVGIPADQLSTLLQDDIINHGTDRDRDSLGLKNVNQRIKLMFGNEYGLEIESHQGQGTTVRIRMSMVHECDLDDTRLTSG